LLEFDRRMGREDNILYKTTEVHKNIKNENKNMGVKYPPKKLKDKPFHEYDFMGDFIDFKREVISR
jgi:hypothetical protein